MGLKEVALLVAALPEQDQLRLATVILGNILAETGVEDIKFAASVPDIGVVTILIQKGNHVRD